MYRRLANRVLPLAVSASLLVWLFTWISPQGLVQAAGQLDWKLLVPVTGAMVLALYFWDAVCLNTVYSVGGQRCGYWQSLHLRGLSYLGGAINYELGQAGLAWGMARLQHTGVLRMLSRSVLLALHDVVVLLGAGLVGSLLTADPRVERIRPYIALSLAVAAAVLLLLWALPTSVRAKIRIGRWESLLEGWNVGRSARLIPLRAIYFGILVVYAALALEICRLSVDRHVVMSTIPLVLLADGLPSFAGLGTRETTLQLLLDPEHPEVLLAMSLFWTTALIVGRAAIGLLHLWAHQWMRGAAAEPPTGGQSR